jgi:2-polyprenyl-3-methyl-5-hydroxy-6-metoxy-1,4-benzoquinol methylase
VSDASVLKALGSMPADDARCMACTKPMVVERTLFDDRYGYPGSYRVLACTICGHRTLDVRMDADQISDLYTSYYPRSTFDVERWSPPRDESALATWWHGLRASAFRWVPPRVRVLDIGCGLGESLGYHRARGCDAQGVETDRNVLHVAERHGLNVSVGLFDPAHYEEASFDYVTLDQVIEHIGEPLRVLCGIQRILKPGGRLIVSTPNPEGCGARVFGSRWIHWHAPYHQQFFTRGSMLRSAQQSGFALESRVTITHSAWLDFQWGHLVTYPTPGRPSAYWWPAAQRSIGQRIALKFLGIADLLGINVLLTRLMDGVGLGDNVVYTLRKQD